MSNTGKHPDYSGRQICSLCHIQLKLILATEFDLASAEYCGVGVLARALFGNGLSLYDDRFESSGQNQPRGDCWIGSCPHQPQMRSFFFPSPHQVLPMYTVLISDQHDNLDGQRDNFSTPTKPRDNFSAPEKVSTDTHGKCPECAGCARLQVQLHNTRRTKKNTEETVRRARKRIPHFCTKILAALYITSQSILRPSIICF